MLVGTVVAIAVVVAAGTASGVLGVHGLDRFLPSSARAETPQAQRPPAARPTPITAGTATPTPSAEVIADPAPTPTPTVTPTATVAPTPETTPEPVLQPGQHGSEVRELQARLAQIAWYSPPMTGDYDAATRQSVRGFQDKRGITATGKVDQRTLELLASMTHEPTAAELANRRPDPADGAALDPRCTTGRAVCIDKSTSSLRWVVDGKVLSSLDVRFGASYTPTREGLFHVYWKDREHVSNLYGSSMPFSMFFSRGQAVHYSSDFAARGYTGASHGCVNVRDHDALARLFDQVTVGDKVAIYWS